MKAKLWLFNLPLILIFCFCYWVTELGVQGELDQPFLRESVFPVLSRARNLLTDLKFKSRGPQPAKNKIVIVEIDSSALETLGRWPWHRDVTSFLIDKSFQAGAKVVGLDMLFSEADPRIPTELNQLLKEKNLESLTPQFETDHQLEEVIRRYADKLVLAWTSETVCQPFYDHAEFCPVKDPNALAQFPADFERFSLSGFHFPSSYDPGTIPMLSFVTPIANISSYNTATQHQGYINAVLDSDGTIRRTSLVTFAKGRPFPSLALEMARVGLGENLDLTLSQSSRIESLRLLPSGRQLRITPVGAQEINFRGPSGSFPVVPALDVLSEKDVLEDAGNQKLTGKSKAEIFKDAYVLIGISALGVFDMRQFPFESNVPGVEGHASILDNLLSGDPLVSSSTGPGRIIIPLMMILGGLLLALAFEKFGAVPALLLFLGAMLGTLFLDFKVLFHHHNNNWNTVFFYAEVMLVFGLTQSLKYILEENDKKFIKGAFSKYVAPQIVDSILKDPTKLSLGGERRELTIIFSDIRSFTTFSEKMDAKALASFLNDYLGIMTKLVFSNQGTLDKYIGDAIMAFWGAPLMQPQHAANACRSAVAMMKALMENQDRFKSQYGIEVNVGVGINSGPVSVGNMGSDQNFSYTVIGDHVNLASRLEGLTKEYGVGILTTRFTLDSIEASGEKPLPFRVLDFVKVKGKANAVELIQILDRELPREGLKEFQAGRDFYTAQQWDRATTQFEKSNRLLSYLGKEDGPSVTFLERCQFFKSNPPSADWDGSWKMETK